ncbi:VacJ family lipoprotein [Novosphingobium album (ex Hu et al. 2023)]|uniref:VacJ family lipoprotein n=1 Tax=Novosphingobium album (ex Hu et al. 2023) TaxID=2930093 RepID=A0ABT0B727_9SPHN|nr:VacJ family lipoprotein [Novosphingobium album (ex Hu et al. 2023)]MCJ2180803.1 VacJ family lipoprotein [Novosphingobium album (ex Hu et al. 2023)]
MVAAAPAALDDLPATAPASATANPDNAAEPAPSASEADSASAANESQAPAIVVTGHPPSPADPVEQFNAVSFQAVQAVDSAVVGPIAHTYKVTIPEPVRDGVHNALNNLDEPIVFLNFLLQLKPGKAIETLGRFAINTTLGVGGLFDVAKKKPFNLPRRSNGLADTLGYYGVGPGPYLFLPVIGSTTVRDLIARPFDLLILPTIAPKPFSDPKVALGKGILSALDEREQDDEKLARIHGAADPYYVQREEYLARRRAEIDVLKGKRKSIYDPPYYELPPLPAKDGSATDANAAEPTLP